MNSHRAATIVFIVLAFGFAWLVALPLWLGDGLASPFLPVIAVIMMATPTIAALIVVFVIERPAHRAQALGLSPLGPVPRFIKYLALGLVIPILLVLQALVVGSLLGLYAPDLVEFSGFRQVIEQQLAGQPLPMPIGVLVAAQLASIVVASLINTIPALGEEIGWRDGYSAPDGARHGTGLLVSGVIWGLWHAPLVLLGYNYPGVPGWLGVLLMCGMCTVVGAVFGWLRIRSGSVWPAALAHGSFNAAAGISLLFSSADLPVDTAQATILGWSGWIVPVIVIGALLVTGRFRLVPPAPAVSA